MCKYPKEALELTILHLNYKNSPFYWGVSPETPSTAIVIILLNCAYPKNKFRNHSRIIILSYVSLELMPMYLIIPHRTLVKHFPL